MLLSKRNTSSAKEERACSRSDSEEGFENGENSCSGKMDAESVIEEHIVEVLQDGTETPDDNQSSIERCGSCEVYLEEGVRQHGQREEDRSTREESGAGRWKNLWQDFSYNLILSFLPTAWDVVSDLRTAQYLEEIEEVGFAGLSFLFVFFPFLYLCLDLLTQKISKSCAGTKVIIVNIACSVSISFAMIILFSNNVLLFKYPAFLVGLGMVSIKGVALFHPTPLMKELSGMVTKYEVATESPLQLLLLLHIWISGGGSLFLGSIASSLLAIGKVNAEVYLSSKPENLLEEAAFCEKLFLIIKFLPLFISTTFFRLGSGIIKHSGPYSRIAGPYSTLFFFITVWSGTIVYTVLYLIIFFGVKIMVGEQLAEVTLYDGARSILAEFSSVSLWGNLGRIRSRCHFFLLHKTIIFLQMATARHGNGSVGDQFGDHRLHGKP